MLSKTQTGDDIVQIGDDVGRERRRWSPHMGVADGSALGIDVLADGHVDTRLVFVADQRAGVIKGLGGAVDIPSGVLGADFDEDLGEPKARHGAVGAMLELFKEHVGAHPAENHHVGRSGAHASGLGGGRFFFELEVVAAWRLAGEVGQKVDAHQNAATDGMVLDHDGDRDCGGDGVVVCAQGGIVGFGQLWRGDHDCIGTQFDGALAVGHRAVGADMTRADADFDAAAIGRHDVVDDEVALGVAKFVDFAHDAQHGDALHAQSDEELDHGCDAGTVDTAVGCEWRGGNGVAAMQERVAWHPDSFVSVMMV